ncbi:MAG: minor capsid protein [Methanoregula sp.]|nr:minor capsid protein [Methanoregula sp.]
MNHGRGTLAEKKGTEEEDAAPHILHAGEQDRASISAGYLTMPETMQADPTRTEWIDQEYEDALVGLFQRLEKAVVRYIKTGDLPDVQKNATPAARMPFNLDEFIRTLPKIIESEVIEPGDEIVQNYAEIAYKHGVMYSKLTLGLDVVLRKGDLDRNILKILKSRNLSELKGISDEVSKSIIRSISSGLLQGEGADDLAKRIRDSTGLGTTRSKAIARSETMKAVNEGVRDRYDKAGVKLLKRLIAGDDRVCDICRAIAQKDNGYGPGIYTLEEAAQIDAEAHPNDRCTWAPFFPDEETD